MDEFEKIVKMCSDLMTMNDNLMNMNKELIAKVQSQGNDKKFEQATTRDGLPMWEYTCTNRGNDRGMNQLGKEGWEMTTSSENTVYFRRPIKKQAEPEYGR